MREELKGAAGVVLFGFAIAATVWILPIDAIDDHYLIAKPPPQADSLTPVAESMQAVGKPVKEPVAASSSSSRPALSGTGLAITCEARTGIDENPRVFIRVTNNGDKLCDCVRIEPVKGAEELNADQLPSECQVREFGDIAMSCALPDVAAGTSLEFALPTSVGSIAESAMQFSVFSWCGERATVASAECIPADEVE